MGIYRSTNPTDWSALDGIYIDEVVPAGSVQGTPTNIAICVGQFERGPANLAVQVGSAAEIYEQFGNNLNYPGLVALQNMKFGALKIVRVVSDDAVDATLGFNHSATLTISFTALWAGLYGNGIKVTIAAGSTAGSKYTIHDSNAGAVWPDEVYDNVLITSTVAQLTAIFGNSNLVAVPVVSATGNEPDTCAATALATGADGTVDDADYQTAITAQQTEALGNVLFLDLYNTTRNGYLKTSMAATTDRMAVMCGAAGDSVSTAVSAVATLRDTQGRLIYAFPYIYTNIQGVSTKLAPGAFYASLLSQIAPNIDPAWSANAQYLAGMTGIELSLQRSDYISLAAAGISAFENDADIGLKIKSGVVTQISNSALVMVFRRRMTDYLTYSIAKYLKPYQNGINSALQRTNAIGGIVAFNRLIETAGLVPSDAEVQGGKASIVDGTSLNSNDSIAQGYFKIQYQRRIYSSMRYIVLQANISTSVVVTEQAA
jgi:hypothetical protein